jgi:hypothetical protein
MGEVSVKQVSMNRFPSLARMGALNSVVKDEEMQGW